MNYETFTLIKDNMELIKGESDINPVYPFIGQGHDVKPSDGMKLLTDASRAGVDVKDFTTKVTSASPVKLSRWNYKQNKEKLQSMVDDPERLKKSPPLLFHQMPDGNYECIDGGHRLHAAQILGLPVKAICMNDKAYKALTGHFNDSQMYRLAQYLYETGRTK